MRFATFVLATLLCCLLVAPSALAADVAAQENGRWVKVTAQDGETNRLTVGLADAVVTVTDTAAGLVAQKGCEQIAAREVRCAITDAARARVDATLGDLDDEVSVTGPLPSKLDGGPGNDRLTGGPATDALDGGEGDDVLVARDGVRESVTCGAGTDAGEADVEDDVAADCEGIVKPLAPPGLDEVQPGDTPRASPGKSVAVTVKTGVVLARVPGSTAFTPLDPSLPVPVGTVLDTTDGTLSLTAAADQVGGTQTADFTGGRFVVDQTPAVTMTTDLRMTGGDFSRCAATATRGAVARAAATRPVRKLWGSGKGRFRTRGRHAAATVRGTVWKVVDRCDGTLTTVVRGIVVVQNLRTRRTKVVRAGESLFVRRAAARRR